MISLTFMAFLTWQRLGRQMSSPSSVPLASYARLRCGGKYAARLRTKARKAAHELQR
jgi:hypothetical protein